MPTHTPKKFHKNYNMTAAEYIKIMDIRKNTTGKIENGKLYALWQGEWILDSEFLKMFPIPDRLYVSMNNPDTRKAFLK